MSGILIKHFIVPQNCMECEWRDAEACGQCELMIDNPFLSFSDQYAHCPFQMIAKRHPIVPVPKHGRLGDLDRMLADNEIYYNQLGRPDGEIDARYRSVKRSIELAPTVIEADRGDDQ